MSDRKIALLRGINVGKAKRIAMADLRDVFSDLGYRDVRTLLNSGNIIFTATGKRGANESTTIERAIADRLGVQTRVIVLGSDELAEAIRANPLKPIPDAPSRLLLMALQDLEAAVRLKPLMKLDWSPETLAVRKRIAYLWCPHGISAGDLWEAVNRAVGDAGTARNLATMTKILALVDEDGR